jgi:hypothetical protein
MLDHDEAVLRSLSRLRHGVRIPLGVLLEPLVSAFHMVADQGFRRSRARTRSWTLV